MTLPIYRNKLMPLFGQGAAQLDLGPQETSHTDLGACSILVPWQGIGLKAPSNVLACKNSKPNQSTRETASTVLQPHR